jgi:NAD(P)-dependent dehydrogenase (short-subunit alcohol dehydrogenase family)
VIAPGTVDTALATENNAMFKLFRPDLGEPTIDDAEPVFTLMVPMGKYWVEPVDVSNAVLYLASDETRSVTGGPARGQGHTQPGLAHAAAFRLPVAAAGR